MFEVFPLFPEYLCLFQNFLLTNLSNDGGCHAKSKYFRDYIQLSEQPWYQDSVNGLQVKCWKTLSKVINKLTFRTWNSVVNIPKFWTWAHIRLEHYDYLKKWENNERIRKLVRNILFTDWGDDMSEQPLCLFWNRILSCEVQLNLVDLSQVCLSDLDSRIIAKFLSR